MNIDVPSDSVVTALKKSARRMTKDISLVAASTSAGVFFPVDVHQKRGMRTGVQVFVQVFRYDEAVKRCLPHTGGLLAYVGKNVADQR